MALAFRDQQGCDKEDLNRGFFNYRHLVRLFYTYYSWLVRLVPWGTGARNGFNVNFRPHVHPICGKKLCRRCFMFDPNYLMGFIWMNPDHQTVIAGFQIKGKRNVSKCHVQGNEDASESYSMKCGHICTCPVLWHAHCLPTSSSAAKMAWLRCKRPLWRACLQGRRGPISRLPGNGDQIAKQLQTRQYSSFLQIFTCKKIGDIKPGEIEDLSVLHCMYGLLNGHIHVEMQHSLKGILRKYKKWNSTFQKIHMF